MIPYEIYKFAPKIDSFFSNLWYNEEKWNDFVFDKVMNHSQGQQIHCLYALIIICMGGTTTSGVVFFKAQMF